MALSVVKPLACATCGHSEIEHGQTGTRPCLAVVGDERHFCPCDEFQPKRLKAA